jgi:hypothetical protein
MADRHSNFNKSSRPSGPNFENFSFLNKRYERGFFVKFVNQYFLLLLDAAKRSHCDPGFLFNEFLYAVFKSDSREINIYSTDYLIKTIYKTSTPNENREFQLFDSRDRFMLAFKLQYFKLSEHPSEYANNEVHRLAGLLVVDKRSRVQVSTQPRLIEKTKDGIKFCEQYVIKKATTTYLKDCAKALDRLTQMMPFARKYQPIAQEYFEFIDSFISDPKNFTTPSLETVLNHWYLHYKSGRIESEQQKTGKTSKSTFDISEMNLLDVKLDYLRGKPHGSNRKT